jgi:Flp pilus assembly pilin Flp
MPTVNAQACNETGQAFTEYTMMLGLLSALIVWMTLLIVPGVGRIIVAFVRHVALYVSSV